MCRASKQEITRDILGYLSENPSAEDTIEGVVEWWLLEQRIKHETLMATDALSDLVRKGLVLERSGHDSRPRYRVNTERLDEIARILGRT